MSQREIQKRLGEAPELPSLPSIVTKVQGMLASGQAGTGEIGAIIAQDPPLTAKILRIANSALYGLREPVVSTQHAASVLGLNAIRNLLVRVSVVDLFAHVDRFPDFDISALWRRSILCAHVAQDLPGIWSSKLDPTEAHLGGLLHAIGTFVLLDRLGEEYIEVWNEAQNSRRELSVVEREAFNFDSDEVGGLVATRWGMPRSLCDAIRSRTREASRRPDEAVAVLYASRRIVDANFEGRELRAATSLPRPTLRRLGAKPDDLDEYASECALWMHEIAV